MLVFHFSLSLIRQISSKIQPDFTLIAKTCLIYIFLSTYMCWLYFIPRHIMTHYLSTIDYQSSYFHLFCKHFYVTIAPSTTIRKLVIKHSLVSWENCCPPWQVFTYISIIRVCTLAKRFQNLPICQPLVFFLRSFLFFVFLFHVACFTQFNCKRKIFFLVNFDKNTFLS